MEPPLSHINSLSGGQQTVLLSYSTIDTITIQIPCLFFSLPPTNNIFTRLLRSDCLSESAIVENASVLYYNAASADLC